MAHLRGSRSSGSLWRFPWDQLQRRHDWKKPSSAHGGHGEWFRGTTEGSTA